MFEHWTEFYLMIGSAAAALIGLLFVVVTLTAGAKNTRIQRGARLFMTPAVFHLAAILVMSAIAMAPRLPAAQAGAALAAAAFVGFVYMAVNAAAVWPEAVEPQASGAKTPTPPTGSQASSWCCSWSRSATPGTW